MDYYGPQHWWPAKEPFEVMVGAILTQSAAWVNVEKAIANLRAAGTLGQETADSIILYAGNKPIFVIDAYTRRIVSRIGLAPDNNSYAAYQHLFMDNLPADVGLYNEYHALLVCLGKAVCRSRPLCQQCCLDEICNYSKNN